MQHELPQGHEYAPEKRPPDIYKKSLGVQAAILAGIDGEPARHEWVEKNAARFRDLLEKDAAFEKLVLDEDVEGVKRRLEQETH
jgi:hypothetical protein